MNTNDEQFPRNSVKTSDDGERFEHKVARQMVALQYPYGKRTNGEMNEDADFVKNNPYFKNVMKLFEAELTKAREISGGDMHEALMNYGKVCEEKGFLSPDAVTIRMDLATYFYDLEQRLARAREEGRLEENAWSRQQMIAAQALEAPNSGFGRMIKWSIDLFNKRKIELLATLNQKEQE